MADDMYSREELQAETLIGLGARFKVGDFTIPAPCPASISLLEVIQSPFVVDTAETDVELQDVLNALYVLINKENAVYPIFKARRRDIVMNKAKDIAGKSPEYYKTYLTILNKSITDYADFDKAVTDFAYKLGAFNYIEVSQKIQLYLNQSFMGFEMMPKTTKEDYEKKNLTSV